MSAMRKLVPLANKAIKERGLKLIRLNIGQPDIETPEPFWDAIDKYKKQSNVLEYAPSVGRPELVESLVTYYNSVGINLSPDEVIVTIGGCEAILIAFMAICDVGDEIIVFEPFYSNYTGIAMMAGVTFVPVETKVTTGYHLPSKEEIEKVITPRTKAIMYASPGNPTGTIYSTEEVQLLVDICRQHNIFLLGDEVYREFCYDSGGISPSVYHMKDVDDFAILFDSFSKRYSACGARVGVVATKNKDVYQAMLKTATVRLSAPVLEQIGIAACINDGVTEYLKKVNGIYKERRDLLVSKVNQIPGAFCPNPEGAFYAMAKIDGVDADDFCKWLLTDFEYNGATILVSPGNGFYSTPGLGVNEIRMAYVINTDDLATALDILHHGVLKYRELKGNSA